LRKGSEAMVLVKNTEYVFKEVKGEAFLLNAKTGDYYGLNDVGCDFLRLVDGRRTVREIEDELMGLYDVEREALSEDLGELARELCANGILRCADA
jgi:hypothetical protein